MRGRKEKYIHIIKRFCSFDGFGRWLLWFFFKILEGVSKPGASPVFKINLSSTKHDEIIESLGKE